jgi:hypothetical protein
MTQMNRQVASKSRFKAIWKSECPEIKLEKMYSEFALCEECCHIQRLINSAHTADERQKHRDTRRLHHEEQRMERNEYYRHRELAYSQPGSYMSIIMDKMDNAKCRIPRVLLKSKGSASSKHFFKQYLNGVLVHGRAFFLLPWA